MSGGPDPGAIIVAIFLIVFGGCFTLAGGGCTLFMLVNITSWGSDIGMILPMLGLSLIVLGVGVLMLRGAMTLLRRHDD